MNKPDRLRQAIRDLHGLDSDHVESVPVHEIFQGKTVWEGDVEVFRVRGHPQAQQAYAWTYEDDDGTLHHVAVLGVPPVNSAQDAVKAAIMAHIEKQRRESDA
jgi:hypothetical protein